MIRPYPKVFLSRIPARWDMQFPVNVLFAEFDLSSLAKFNPTGGEAYVSDTPEFKPERTFAATFQTDAETGYTFLTGFDENAFPSGQAVYVKARAMLDDGAMSAWSPTAMGSVRDSVYWASGATPAPGPGSENVHDFGSIGAPDPLTPGDGIQMRGDMDVVYFDSIPMTLDYRYSQSAFDADLPLVEAVDLLFNQLTDPSLGYERTSDLVITVTPGPGIPGLVDVIEVKNPLTELI